MLQLLLLLRARARMARDNIDSPSLSLSHSSDPNKTAHHALLLHFTGFHCVHLVRRQNKKLCFVLLSVCRLRNSRLRVSLG